MSRIHYIMFEGFTGIVENIYDELGHKLVIAVELGVFQQALLYVLFCYGFELKVVRVRLCGI